MLGRNKTKANMKLEQAFKCIGSKVHLNGNGDLAFDGTFRPYIYPKPTVPFVFTVLKCTKGGKVYIQSDYDKKMLSVKASNLDLIVESAK